MARSSARWLPVLVVGLALAGCGGGHSHASTPGAGTQGAAGPQVAVAGGTAVQPQINGPATTGQASAGGGGSVSSGSVGAGGSQVIGFPVGPLLPTTIDAGQCQAAQFADKSVYAQIALAHATCTQVPAVAAGADHARGESYSAAGFTCVGSGPQPSNGYWISSYYSYDCRNGNDQIAFNWGTSSSRF